MCVCVCRVGRALEQGVVSQRDKSPWAVLGPKVNNTKKKKKEGGIKSKKKKEKVLGNGIS